MINAHNYRESEKGEGEKEMFQMLWKSESQYVNDYDQT